MKLENLAIIFVIIIVPLTLVFSEYIDGKIDTAKLELVYNKRLLGSTQDAINAYKENTINNSYGDVTNSKITDIMTATNIFMNSLAASFNYVGQKAGQMKEYVPAVAFTLYDGYYIYSPFNNILTEVNTEIDTNYSPNGELYTGLKPYVYYTCRYTKNTAQLTDFYITYTLDNYITITGYINGSYVYDYGYLYSISGENGIKRTPDGAEYKYTYDGVTFRKSETEQLKEFVGNTEYSYVKINGTKYYLDNSIGNECIFYLDNNGNRGIQAKKSNEEELYNKYKKAIENNKSAYEYYKNAYDFSCNVYNTYNLDDLETSNAVISTDDDGNLTNISEYGNFKIFDDENGAPQYESSNFNNHRKAVIRYVVETNLAAAISGYSSKYVDSFIMPKISEEDWDLIQNNSCAISFMQGMSLGRKKYNGYSVVANSFTKEHIDEKDIYILSKNDTYCRVNDKTLYDGITHVTNVKPKEDYYSGIWKLNFEQKKELNSTGGATYYVPVGQTKYTGSYTSIVGINGTNVMPENDVYRYLNESSDIELKKAYYYALGRERWGAFNINNINFEIYGGNGSEYFLKDY